MTKVKWEESFVVYWISFKCFLQFCFICIESAEGSHPSLEKLVRFIENLQNCETFCLSQEFDECFIRVSHIGSLMEVLITLHVY